MTMMELQSSHNETCPIVVASTGFGYASLLVQPRLTRQLAPQGGHIAATWSDSGKAHIWDLSPLVASLEGVCSQS